MSNFYWHCNVENGNKLKDELLNVNKVKKVNIATAYFSKEGLKILKEIKNRYKLNKSNIDLYLSPDFSMDNPNKLLEELKEICMVYIVFNIKFHPKVYWIESTDKSKIIFGSSNLTKGGFEDNIEFDIIKEVDSKESNKLKIFFEENCKKYGELVDDNIIKYYEEQVEEIEKLRKINTDIYKRLCNYIKKEDEFQEEDYNLNDMYFNYRDYETLFKRNQKSNDLGIRERRKIIQEKLLEIHKKIYSQIKKENLYCHWNSNNITSQIIPNEYNKYKVGWVIIRYGKSEEEVRVLSGKIERDDFGGFGFQKHACLQFALVPNGFEINLFHSVKNDAIDRDFLHDNINKRKDKIIKELNNLKGEGLEWIINDEKMSEFYTFKIDDENPSEFIEFYKKYDKPGMNSQLVYYLEPNDERLKNIQSISAVVLEKIKMLIPLYKLVAYRF